MKKINFFIAALAVLLLAASCGKDGAVGPQGAKGDTGVTGATGPIGPAGTNGSVIFSGTGAPASTTGATGDYYIDLSSANFYGPKTTSGWGAPISLKGTNGANGATGATGAAGAAGSKILSGSGAPAASLGSNGDYYLDKTNYLFYGPKTSGSWGTGLNIQGPQGLQGNANVQIDTFTVKTTDWAYGDIYYFGTSPNVSSGYFAQYYDRANIYVTDAILNGAGMVMVYFQATPDLYTDLWQPLPYSFPVFSGYGYNYYYQPTAGNIRLDFFFNKITANPPAVNGYQIPNHKFKIMVISGTLIDVIKNNHVDLKDYNAMAKVTGVWLQDKLR